MLKTLKYKEATRHDQSWLTTRLILHKHWPSKRQGGGKLWLPNSTRFEKLPSNKTKWATNTERMSIRQDNIKLRFSVTYKQMDKRKLLIYELNDLMIQKNQTYLRSLQTQVWDLSGAELMKVLANWKTKRSKVLLVYATADMDGTDRANIYKRLRIVV